jgi:hypothetical protein
MRGRRSSQPSANRSLHRTSAPNRKMNWAPTPAGCRRSRAAVYFPNGALPEIAILAPLGYLQRLSQVPELIATYCIVIKHAKTHRQCRRLGRAVLGTVGYPDVGQATTSHGAPPSRHSRKPAYSIADPRDSYATLRLSGKPASSHLAPTCRLPRANPSGRVRSQPIWRAKTNQEGCSPKLRSSKEAIT